MRAVIMVDLRGEILQAPSPDVIVNQNDPVGNRGFRVSELVRQHAFLSLLVHAHDVLLAHAMGSGEVPDSAVGGLAKIYMAGHVSVSFHQET